MKAKNRTEKWEERKERSKLNRAELEELETRRSELRRKLEEKDANPDTANTVAEEGSELDFQYFNQLPLSQRTMMGVERGHYKRMTPVQCDALHLALAGFDVLGAAKTGSGKTLCFIIPILEQLFIQHWSPEMGVGAIVLTPTRELALQIFKVIQLVGYKHVLSAALLTGGRDVNEEKKRLHAISIIIGTPGRILHHLQDTSDLVLDNLQILCMDEADRLLDMGFRDSITSILKYLPTERQTLLFSATQTTDVEMLAQMSLKNPRYVTAQGMSKMPTPATLSQNFIVVELHKKLDALLAFLKKHPADKVVVFSSTCNQVKYMYLSFSKILKKMRIPSMCLTSKMKQFRREEVFLTFCRCKSAVLFCTDVAARGLDFPLVHWVIQHDCPDSVQTYIHRVGRTARAGAKGAAVLFLTPREVPFLSFLAHKNIPMREIAIRPSLLQNTREIFVALVVQGLKYEAQKAFIAYIRSVYFSSNKLVFDIESIDQEAFARSLGLPVVPDLSSVEFRRSAKNLPWAVVNALTGKGGASQTLTRKEKHLQASDMFRQLEQKQKYAPKDEKNESSDDDNGDFLTKKPKQAAEKDEGLTMDERLAGLSKHKIRKYIESADLRVRDLGINKHVVFDSDEDEEGDQRQQNDVTMGSLRSIVQSDEADEPTNEEEYVKQLRHHLGDSKVTDAERAKLLRRVRKLQRIGKLSKRVTLDEGQDLTKKTREAPEGGSSSSDDFGGESDEDGESDSDDDLNNLVLLAQQQKRKENGIDDSDDEPYHPVDSDDEIEEPKKRRKV